MSLNSTESKLTLGVHIFLILLALAVIFGGSCIIPITTKTDVREPIQVKRMENVNNSGGSKYLVYSKSGEVFENTDVLVYGKFNSSDIYGRMKEGACYRVTTEGIRFRFLSWYRNILSATKVDCP